ncbi:ComEC/Rec2 family competence protein [Actinospongicola halichondriae]|uniref:ComEC/Rec2 family competence protein n=1 Tax=Actinospongicola halichondriae TaxID=3236844 RepID=UPI003D55AF67
MAAVASALGAAAATPVPVPLLIAVAVAVGVVRKPWTWCLLLFVATDVLAVRSLAGLDPPPDAPFVGVVTAVTDPEPITGGRLRLEVDSLHGHLLAEVRSPHAIAALSTTLAGDRVSVSGVTGPLRRSTEWTRSRHLAGTLRVESVATVTQGGGHHAAANAFRRTLERGAGSLSPTQRSLLAGLVLGDDRAQPPQLTADFRAAGLTHLLAVSGQNVVFVLVVVGPFLRMLRLWPRFLVTVAVIAAFALVTRFEPSVLRASFVAVVAVYAHTTGRPSGGVRHLSIAICILLVVDPLLVHSLGFRLSVAASCGVLVLAPRIAAGVRGPNWFRDGLAVTIGAQCAVAPVLIPTLGPMPLAAIPANLVAGPIAGLLMVWGLTAGTVAGVVGGRAAWLLHRPSVLGLGALDQVSGLGASLPMGTVDLRHVGVALLGVGMAVCRPRAIRVLGSALAAVALVAPILVAPPRGSVPAGWAATIWVDGPVAVVDLSAGADPVAVVETLRQARVRAVGLVVVRSSKATMSSVVDAIDSRFPVGAVVGPPGLDHPDAVVAPAGFRVRVGRFAIVVDRPGPPMRVRVGWRASGEVAAPTAAVGSPGAPGARRPRNRRDPPSGGRRRRRAIAPPDLRRRRGPTGRSVRRRPAVPHRHGGGSHRRR